MCPTEPDHVSSHGGAPLPAWAMDLLAGLLRREVISAETPEMSEWFITLLEELEQDFSSQKRLLAEGAPDMQDEVAEKAAMQVFAYLSKSFSSLER